MDSPLLLNEEFAESRREQEHYIKTAEIQRNLRQTTETALRVLSTLAERGETLDKQEEHAQQVLESSEELARQAAAETSGRCLCVNWRWWWWSKKKPRPASKKKIFRFSK